MPRFDGGESDSDGFARNFDWEAYVSMRRDVDIT